MAVVVEISLSSLVFNNHECFLLQDILPLLPEEKIQSVTELSKSEPNYTRRFAIGKEWVPDDARETLEERRFISNRGRSDHGDMIFSGILVNAEYVEKLFRECFKKKLTLKVEQFTLTNVSFSCKKFEWYFNPKQKSGFRKKIIQNRTRSSRKRKNEVIDCAETPRKKCGRLPATETELIDLIMSDTQIDADNTPLSTTNQNTITPPDSDSNEPVDELNTAQQHVDEPDIHEPDVVEPEVDEVDEVDEPDVDEPGVHEPDVDEVDEPDVDEEADEEVDEYRSDPEVDENLQDDSVNVATSGATNCFVESTQESSFIPNVKIKVEHTCMCSETEDCESTSCSCLDIIPETTDHIAGVPEGDSTFNMDSSGVHTDLNDQEDVSAPAEMVKSNDHAISSIGNSSTNQEENNSNTRSNSEVTEATELLDGLIEAGSVPHLCEMLENVNGDKVSEIDLELKSLRGKMIAKKKIEQLWQAKIKKKARELENMLEKLRGDKDEYEKLQEKSNALELEKSVLMLM